jgi:uroporphyrinogen decarboxylase
VHRRDRLEAAIGGGHVDRVPVALWRHWPGDDQRADDQAAAHIGFQAAYDWDFVKISPSSSFCLDQWGVEDRWDGSLEGTRTYLRWPVSRSEDWLQVQKLDVFKGGLGQQLRCLDILRDAFGDEVPFIQTIFNPLAQAKHLAAEGVLELHIRQKPVSVHAALRAITDTTIDFVREAVGRGIAGIYYAVQHANYHDLTEAEYAAFGRPYDLEILAAVKELWLNVLHIHGAEIMFDQLADYPVQVVNWHDRETQPSLSTGLKKLKGAASGGVGRMELHLEDPEPALEQARDAFKQTGGQRWILGTGCVSMVTTPVGNIRKLRDLAATMTP